jgi:acetate kinase
LNIEFTQLSPEKKKFVHYLKFLNSNITKPSEIIKKIGISKSTYYRWLKDKNLKKISEEIYIDESNKHLPVILNTLLDKALQGDVSAIKLFLKRIDKINKKLNNNLTTDEIINLIRKTVKENKLKKQPLKNEKISQN